MTMKQLYFIRHGESEANVARVFAGLAETPLTAKGKQQAKLAGQQAAELGIDHIIASPISRAYETAKIIAKEIGYPEDKIETNSLLVERDYGSLQGKPWDLDVDLDGIVDVETTDSVMNRAVLTYEHLQGLSYETILVVSHGTFGLALKAVVDSAPFFRDTDGIRNAEVTRFV